MGKYGLSISAESDPKFAGSNPFPSVEYGGEAAGGNAVSPGDGAEGRSVAGPPLSQATTERSADTAISARTPMTIDSGIHHGALGMGTAPKRFPNRRYSAGTTKRFSRV